MTLQRLFEDTAEPVRRRRGHVLLLVAASLLLGCGGGGHGTMMAQTPDAGGASGNQGAGGAGGARADAGTDATVGDAGGGDVAANDAPVKINVTVDRCPTVLAAASPSMTTLDKAVAVDATADDPDGDALTYAWTAPTGTFAMATAASTTYTCAKAGDVMLTVTVSDRRCDGQAAIPFTCLATP